MLSWFPENLGPSKQNTHTRSFRKSSTSISKDDLRIQLKEEGIGQMSTSNLPFYDSKIYKFFT
jgi:hypothetical protein